MDAVITMPVRYQFSRHAEKQVRERLRIDTNTLLNLIRGEYSVLLRMYAHECETYRYVLIWDRVLGSAVLVVLGQTTSFARRNKWRVVTLYPVTEGQGKHCGGRDGHLKRIRYTRVSQHHIDLAIALERKYVLAR
jgi:hypothetical protein